MSDDADVIALRVSGKWVDQGTIDRANETVLAADALAKAVSVHLRYVIAANPNISLDGMDKALAAYEAVRGPK